METIKSLSVKAKSFTTRLRRLAESADGKWVAVKGSYVFIPEGGSFKDALNKSLERDKKNPWKRDADGTRPGPANVDSGGFKIPPPPGAKNVDEKGDEIKTGRDNQFSAESTKNYKGKPEYLDQKVWREKVTSSIPKAKIRGESTGFTAYIGSTEVARWSIRAKAGRIL